MHLLRISCILLSAIFFFVEPKYSIAQPQPNINQLSIPYSERSAIIDGEMNDDIWRDALIVPLTIVNSPLNNEKSPVDTQAKIIENGQFIYIAFVAQDPAPENIQGFLADRDTTWTEDLVGIKLDTFNSRQLNYNFFVNPFGVQNDSIGNEITGESNTLWDGIWQSYGKKTSTGYQVEIAIPYNTLNFEENNDIKTWAIELVRLYPRDERLRISHISLDRNNDCWVCQMPEIKGFKEAKIGDNLLLTPAIVANNNQTRDIYTPSDNWHKKDDIDTSLDLRWGPNANTLLNVTINPDFSTVESDSGQLAINKTFSLYYDEKRSFFLENSDYFSSNYDLVYTRNIADPDYGVKLTGRDKKHSYGVFVTNDTETNFIIPGNVSNDIASLNKTSHSGAFNYRYNFSNSLSLGAVSTMRTAENYHNIVAGFDAKFRLDDSNTLSTQILHSNTLYPNELYKDFCRTNTCNTKENSDCIFGDCTITEQVHRTDIQGEFEGQAYKAQFEHDSEYWKVEAEHQKIQDSFRADLGFITKTDFQENKLSIDRLFYGDSDSLWQEITLKSDWNLQQSEGGDLLKRSLSAGFEVTGPMLSLLTFNYTKDTKVGLRHDDSIIEISGNTDQFDESLADIYAEFQPTAHVFAGVGIKSGDQIDYRNNRLGEFQEMYTYIQVHASDHLYIDLYHTYSKLDADNDNVYSANLTDLRISYQFDVQSYLKLSLVYSDINRNPKNNPFFESSEKNSNLSTQLIYAYKLNPQTVFFLGYSDNSYQDDYLNSLRQEQRTFFTKISYAWMP
jgi:hypothetical protein